MLGALLAAAIPSAVSGAVNYFSQENTNRQAERVHWQTLGKETELANTAHQREVADLRAVGLNPYLTTQGQGAATPSGGSPSITAPSIQMPDMMSGLISMKQLEQTQEKINIDKAKLGIDALNAEAERAYKGIKTFNESYSINNAISRFFKGLYNKKGENLSMNDILGTFKKFQQSTQTPQKSFNENHQQQQFDTPSSLIGVP